MTFADLGLEESLQKVVAAEGYTHPTPIQTQAIPHILAGRDLLGCAQTGTGKTAAFALPILQKLAPVAAQEAALANEERRGQTHGRRRRGEYVARPYRPIRALILAPTRELAVQIHESFQAYGRRTRLRATTIFGGVSQFHQVRALEEGVDIVIATPGRLVDLIQQEYVNLKHVEMLVLDEADRMFDMGFLPDMKRIINRLPKQRQNLLFSATMPEPIEELANAILRDPARIRIAPEKPTVEAISQSVCFVNKHDKASLLARYLKDKAVTRAIVFTRTKHGADKVARQLSQAGLRAEAIHGNKSQNARQRALACFRSSHPPVLVATDIAARGIDVDGVSHVINYDLPREPETYVHRIGRTGRAGATGVAFSLCDHEDRGLLRAIEKSIRKPIPVHRNAEADSSATSETNSFDAAAIREQPKQLANQPFATVNDHRPREFNRDRSREYHDAVPFHGDAHRGSKNDEQPRQKSRFQNRFSDARRNGPSKSANRAKRGRWRPSHVR